MACLPHLCSNHGNTVPVTHSLRSQEAECKRRLIQLFVLLPKTPELKGAVEGAQRTHTEEFYEVYDCYWTVTKLNQELIDWERIYNTVRPHQSLNYLTPLPYLQGSGIVPTPYPSLSQMY